MKREKWMDLKIEAPAEEEALKSATAVKPTKTGKAAKKKAAKKAAKAKKSKAASGGASKYPRH